jgi:8-oxo-dGTP pyrophosphatase MutT (NUDIX family)
MAQPHQPPAAFPISVKGVVVQDGRVLLLRNEREEWELPGGKLQRDETPEQCLAREIIEETEWTVTTGPILDSWLYHIAVVNKDVFIVTYGCYPTSDTAPMVSCEHTEVGLFTEAQVPDLTMPAGYKRSVATWFALLHADQREAVG